MRYKGSVFDQQVLAEFPGLLTASELVTDLELQFADFDIPQETMAQLRRNLDEVQLWSLQGHWAWLCRKGHTGMDAPPNWRPQKERALLAASLGTQRAPGNSTKGVDHML